MRLGRAMHRGPRLGPEVLDDHLLDVVIAQVQVADRQQRLGALARRLADAHEDAGRERDRQAPRILDRAQPHGRHLVRRTEVRTPFGRKALARRLEHDPHRGTHVLQPSELLVGHHAGIQVRQQPRVLDHPDRDGANVVERGVVTAGIEPRAGLRVALLWPIPEREQRLLASGARAGRGDRDNLVGGQVRGVKPGRRLREGAVVAVVAAQHRQRHEDLARVGDGVAPSEVAQTCGDGEEVAEVVALCLEQRGELIGRERLAGVRPGQCAPTHGVGRRGGPVGHRGRAYYP